MKSFAMWGCLAQAALLSGATAIAAPADPYKITSKEKAACTTDAIRFCSHTYPDAAQLMQCMKENRSSLSSICLAAFDAGMKRRHLN